MVKGMRRFFLLFLLISSLFLAAGVFRVSQLQGQNQDQYSLRLQGLAWNQATISTLIVTSDNESWWNPLYLNSTLRAIGQWNDAIAGFALNNSNFAYLSNLRIEASVLNETQSGFDVYIGWTESPLSNVSDEIGLSKTFTKPKSAIINCTINLATHTHQGDALSDGDLQNIALHELGHSLGLGHCNSTGDLMYPTYTLLSSAEGVSTLDVYGVATVFAWMINSSMFYPVSGWLKENSVILPSEIAYQYLPVSPQNARPQTLIDNPVVHFFILMFEVLIHPEILAIVLVFIMVMVVIALIPRRRKRG
jgi:hypothetical protein